MIFQRRIGIWMLGLFAWLDVQANDVTLNLNDLISEFEANNPSLKAAKAAWESSAAKVPQASYWKDPELQLKIENAYSPESQFGSEVDVMAVQEIPFPGKLKGAKKIATAEAEMANQEYRNERLSRLRTLKSIFFELVTLHQSLRIINEIEAVLKAMVETMDSLYAVGKVPQSDLLKARLEVAQLEDERWVFKEKIDQAEAELRFLLGRDSATSMGVPSVPNPTPFDLDLSDLTSLAVEHSPMILEANSRVVGSKASLQLAKLEPIPNFMVGAGWSRDRMNNVSMWEVETGIRIPIFSIFKLKHRLKEESSRLNAAERIKDAKRLELMAMLDQANVKIQTAKGRRLLIEKTLLPQARLTFESSVAAYTVGGRTEFITVLDNLKTVLRLEMDSFERLAEHEAAVATIESLVGLSLDEMNHYLRSHSHEQS